MKRILGKQKRKDIRLYFLFLLKFKTESGTMLHRTALSSERTPQCLFAYSLDDSVQSIVGIVSDIIRRMIKQSVFATFSPRDSSYRRRFCSW